MSSRLQSALRFSEKGPINTNLKVSSIPIPQPQHSQCLVQIHASAINPSDVGNVEGRFRETTLPRTPGRDFAGTIIQGPDGTFGKNIWGTGGKVSVDRDGSHAEYILVPSDCISEMPKNLSFSQAAACGVGYLTASAMLAKAKLEKGNHALVLGSSGAVGSAAVQLIKQLGAIPLETSRKGGSSAINITEDLLPQIEAKSEGRGVAAVLDTVGEAALFRKALEALGDNGQYVLITAGRTPDFQFTFHAMEFYRHNKSMHGVNTLIITSKEAAAELTKMKPAFESGELSPPAMLEETDLTDEKAVIAAYEKVKGGAKAKQILINKNL